MNSIETTPDQRLGAMVLGSHSAVSVLERFVDIRPERAFTFVGGDIWGLLPQEACLTIQDGFIAEIG